MTDQEIYIKSLEIAALMIGPTKRIDRDAEGRLLDAGTIDQKILQNYTYLTTQIFQKILSGDYC